MAMTHYLKMTRRQAAHALEEYLSERPAALARLREELAIDGPDPDALLDGTPQSLTPLWVWVASRIMTPEDEDVPWVLKSPLDASETYPPNLVAVEANRLRRGMGPLREDEITEYATTVITELRGKNEPVPVVDEPLVEVGADGDEGVFDVGLHEEIAHEHSHTVNRLVKELATQPGVVSAHREDREVVLVRAPDWDAHQLEQWVLDWLKARIPELG